MSKTIITYKDFAVGADEDAVVSAVAESSFSEIDRLPFGLTHEQFATLEQNAWVLNSSKTFIDNQRVAFWSFNLSGADGTFATIPTITFDFEEHYSSSGITITFDSSSGDFCSRIMVEWYSNGELLDQKEFFPDKYTYFCNNVVEGYNRIVVSLLQTNLPFRFGKVEQVVFGRSRAFTMLELRDAKVVNEVNFESIQLPVSTLRWTLDSREDVEYIFQFKQVVEVTNDNNLIGVYYIDNAKRKSEDIYSITCHNAFGVLDYSRFEGGAYLGGISAKALFSEIVGRAFSVNYEVEDVTLYGVLLASTRREAAQQVLFAWGVCASTDGVRGIRVFRIPDEAEEIDPNRVYTTPSTEIASIVTEVRVAAHTYSPSDNGGVEINGIRYLDQKTIYTVKNPNVTLSDKENIKEVNNATLVSTHNGAEVTNRIYNHYSKRNTNRVKIVWNGERLGDCVNTPNGWGANNTGNISRMNLILSNTVAADCTTIG